MPLIKPKRQLQRTSAVRPILSKLHQKANKNPTSVSYGFCHSSVRDLNTTKPINKTLFKDFKAIVPFLDHRFSSCSLVCANNCILIPQRCSFDLLCTLLFHTVSPFRVESTRCQELQYDVRLTEQVT